jgi:hypothetical protein
MRDVTEPADRRWTTSKKWAATFFVLFFGIQLALPTLRLFADGPMQRFGWQMYSGVRIQPEFSIEHSDGRVEPVKLSDYVAYSRDEVELDERLSAHICRCRKDAKAVRVKFADREEVFPCP